MLSRLYIENIAVIERAEIEFDRGFNVLTGETGAGKSILVDAIHAVLGERTSRELIRTGAQKAFVSAQFDGLSDAAAAALRAMDVEPDEADGMLLLQREIRADGRSSVRINDRPATLSRLREVGQALIDIHGQHENQSLLRPERHMTYLDRMGGYTETLASCRRAYEAYAAAVRELRALRTDDAEKARRMDRLRYEIDEIEAASVTVGETETLRARREILLNAERIAAALGGAYAALQGGEETDGALGLLQNGAGLLDEVAGVMPACGALGQRMQGLVYELEDIASELHDLQDDNESSPYELDEIETRLETLGRLTRKYGDEEATLAYLASAREELDRIERADELLEEATRKTRVLYREAVRTAEELTAKRRETAHRFCEAVGKELAFLDMPSVRLEVEIKPRSMGPDGADEVAFLISANPGEPPRPLARIASGGELSRMMLAIKTVLADIDDIDTMIFDEVDTGISGRAAYKVGRKLHEVSRSRQIISITHLAQMAAQADAHLLIEKKVNDGRTFTSVRALSFTERVRELARINGGDAITESQCRTAEELLNQAGFFAPQDGTNKKT